MRSMEGLLGSALCFWEQVGDAFKTFCLLYNCYVVHANCAYFMPQALSIRYVKPLGLPLVYFGPCVWQIDVYCNLLAA